jgi:putative flippase GtrA
MTKAVPSSRHAVVQILSLRIVRFVVSSGASAVVGAVVLVGGYAWLGVAPWLCSLISFCAAGATSYLLYRRWAFNVRERSRLVGELFPFVGLSVATLVLASAAAQLGASLGRFLTPNRSEQSLVVLASVLTASVLAIPLRYLACRWIFTGTRAVVRGAAPSLGSDVLAD